MAVEALRKDFRFTGFWVNSQNLVVAVVFAKLPDLALLKVISQFRYLETVCFERSRLHSDRGTGGFESSREQSTQCVNIEHINILFAQKNLRKLQFFRIPINSNAMGEIQSSRLVWLRLRGCNLRDTHLKQIATCQSLTSLTLANNPKITSNGVIDLLHKLSLETLYLSQHEFSTEQRTLIAGNANGCKLMFFSRVWGGLQSVQQPE